ncbi:MAG TPA: hypothetical protein VGO93_00230, partial [Candidatus Xenobia bacterium]
MAIGALNLNISGGANGGFPGFGMQGIGSGQTQNPQSQGQNPLASLVQSLMGGQNGPGAQSFDGG